MNNYSKIAAPIISEVLQATQGCHEKEIRKALREAYPFNGRDHHPYKIWCDEIAVQRGTKKPKPTKPVEKDPNQSEMFV